MNLVIWAFTVFASTYAQNYEVNGTGSVSNQLGINQVLPDRVLCGLDTHPSIIWNHDMTDYEEFPWMAVLEYKNKSTGVSLGIKCGGSLITERYILTAAHCLGYRDVEVSRAWLGDWNITSDPDCQRYGAHTKCSDPVQKINIARIIPHSGFSEATGKDNIGLLRLERVVKFTKYISPICLPMENFEDPSGLATVAGWGIKDNGKESDVKLKMDVSLLSNAACNDESPVPLTANQSCAERVRDWCKEDSGGPLMQVYHDNITANYRWYQEGVISYGFRCSYGYPVIYTRVLKYVDWIVNAILQDKF